MTTAASASRRITPSTYILAAWIALVLLTMCTWWLGSEHDIAGLGQKVSVTTILVLTFAKVYVVGNAFMELREAARWLVLTFTIWCIALCAVLTGMYLTM